MMMMMMMMMNDGPVGEEWHIVSKNKKHLLQQNAAIIYVWKEIRTIDLQHKTWIFETNTSP